MLTGLCACFFFYPKCIRINLRECKDQTFSGGACPQTSLVCRASTKHGFPPPSLKSCMKPWQRWALLLWAYSYDIRFRPTAAHSNVDCLSRLPTVENDLPAAFAEATAINLAQLESLPLRTSEIRIATHSDPILSKILRYLKYGWPNNIPQSLLPFWRRRYELTVEGECILWGLRVVVPTKLQSRVLAELHRGHPGVVRMKAVA